LARRRATCDSCLSCVLPDWSCACCI
jgi:hypothetical protein